LLRCWQRQQIKIEIKSRVFHSYAGQGQVYGGQTRVWNRLGKETESLGHEVTKSKRYTAGMTNNEVRVNVETTIDLKRKV
jgi:hypothetical protein